MRQEREGLTDRERRILDYLSGVGRATLWEIAPEIGYNNAKGFNSCSSALSVMLHNGLIVVVGLSKRRNSQGSLRTIKVYALPALGFAPLLECWPIHAPAGGLDGRVVRFGQDQELESFAV
ncbi:MAG TPA: hypothetical protein VF077_13425 [Nitrospiraceae bacterium]